MNEHFSICCSALRRELGITLTLMCGRYVPLFALIKLVQCHIVFWNLFHGWGRRMRSREWCRKERVDGFGRRGVVVGVGSWQVVHRQLQTSGHPDGKGPKIIPAQRRYHWAGAGVELKTVLILLLLLLLLLSPYFIAFFLCNNPLLLQTLENSIP